MLKASFIKLVAEGNKVFYWVIGLFDQLDGKNRTGNLTQVGWATFNEKSQIISFHVNNLNIGNLIDGWILNSKKIRTACYVANQYCKGANLQFKNDDECIKFMNEIPEASFCDGKTNSTSCRYIHALLASIDPTVHCPHIGPSGGGKCVNVPYEAYYDKYY